MAKKVIKAKQSEEQPLSPEQLELQSDAHEALRRASSVFIRLARSARREHIIAVSGVLEVLVEALERPAETTKALKALRTKADGIRGKPTGTLDDLFRGSGTPLVGRARAAAASALLTAVKEFRSELRDDAEEVFRRLAELIWFDAHGDIEHDKDADVNRFVEDVREHPNEADHRILGWALQACGMSSRDAAEFTKLAVK